MMNLWNGTAGWGHYTMSCFYCHAAVFLALPVKCWRCGCKLSKPVTPEMRVVDLSDLCASNGKRLTFNVAQRT